MSNDISRRDFFAQSAFYGSSLWLLLTTPRPRAARAALESTQRTVLTEGEWRTVEAISGRIIPTDREPGAIEANCVNFIDKALAHEDAAMQPLYHAGVAGTDAVAKTRFGKSFLELSPDQQDDVLAALEAGKAEGWPDGAIKSREFFEAVRVHTIIGFLADPKYGGNRDYAGWKVIGYPGPRHHVGGYTPEQMLGQQKIKTVWGEEI
jgi:gluconate 2-dehydrogenase gamma chain